MMFSYSIMQHAFAVEKVARIQQVVARERIISKLKRAAQDHKK